MGELRTSVIVDLGGNLSRKAPQFAQSFTNFSRTSQRSADLMKRSLVGLDRQLDRIGNRYTALLTGAAATGAVNQVINFDAVITRMGTSALLSEKKVQAIKESILEIANLPDIRISDDQLATSVKKLFELTGDVSFVESNIKNLGLTIQGLGADAVGSAELVAQLWEKGIRDPERVEAVMDRLFSQFAKAKIPPESIARVAPELFSIITTKGEAAVNQMAALLQIFSKAAGNAEKSVTAMRGTFAVFDDADKVKKIDAALENAGFEKIHKANGELRDTHQLLLDIVEVSGNSTQVLNQVFEREALYGLKALLAPENKALLLELVEAEVQRGVTHQAAAKNAGTAASALTKLGNAGRKYANDNLSKPITELADAVNKLKPEQIEDFFDKLKTGAIILGSLVVASKGLKLLGGLSQVLRGGKAAAGGGGIGGALGAAGATPVWVVNMPGGGIGGGGGTGTGSPGGGKGRGGRVFDTPSKAQQRRARIRNRLVKLNAGRVGTLARGGLAAARVAGAVGAAGLAGYGVGTVIYKTALEGTSASDSIGRNIARLLSLFGNDEARASLERERKGQELSGTIRIQVEGPGRVTDMRSSNQGVDIEAEHRLGPAMVVPG